MCSTNTTLAHDNFPVESFDPHLDEPEQEASEPRGRDYRAHVQALFDAVPHKHPGCWTGAELASVTVPYPQHGDRWGAWQLDGERLCLVFKRGHHVGYEVGIERIHDSASMLDWIFQVRGWTTAQDISDLITALDDIFDPQANLCSWGQSKRIKPTEFLTKRLKGKR